MSILPVSDDAAIYPDFSSTPLQRVSENLHRSVSEVVAIRRHGHLGRWLEDLQRLKDHETSVFQFDLDCPAIGGADELSALEKAALLSLLQSFKPWRKGPFDFFGITVDAEWRSSLKWNRLSKSIQPLENRLVLDVGCGNGYYICRMLGAGARYVLGIEPSQLFTCQFNTVKHYVKNLPAAILPLRFEEYPRHHVVDANIYFDSIFDMGILYHRKDPRQHLVELSECMRPGGELILETLVIEGDSDTCLIPEGSYAKMPNVWSVPTEKALNLLLHEAGFENIRTLDISRTTIDEQRKTRWMDFESLQDFLDSADSSKTIEGYPAPRRIVVTANTPD